MLQLTTHDLFLKRTNLSYRQGAKVAKANKIDVSACGQPAPGKLGVLGVLAVKKGANVALQEKLWFRGALFLSTNIQSRSV